MHDEVVNPSTATETPAPAQVDPESLSAADYRTLRETGKAPEPIPSAAADEAAETEPDSEPGDDNQEHDGEKPEPKKKGGFQKRIEKLLRENSELKGKLAGNAAQPGETKPAAEVAEPAATGKPQVANFATYEEYNDALVDWKLEQREATQARAAAEARAKADQQAAAKRLQGQLETARERYEDFDDVALSDAPISAAVHEAIMTADAGAELAYYLGKNPAERERINGLSPIAASLALGKILAKFDSTPENQKPNVSGAPAPIKPLGTKTAVAPKRVEDMSSDEYRKARESGKIR